ncbi:hypothetical protein C7B62_07100 [Pleurocapsa sp. CCALA 161]|uniref:DUF6391 domain-containing protein n=1 Tax=Pleurocapsa sp. CCALA 161 TaxID=2107688 RepID=UPI000D06E4D1|nr:DUF6391 domain-containing protein [Pleurocapsa sp. CCALA 161]PSB11006.1 hypothetical protein C7B62_07100 [Pleurocapsa sp. CCALA 161]
MNDVIFPNSELDSYFHPERDIELLKQFGFIPGLKDFLVIRQVHALEHATVWMLSDTVNSKRTKLSTSYLSADNETIGGLSTEKGFYLYGEINPFKLRKAVNLALIRLQQGEWNLALHPRCGTNSSVAAMLTAGMAVTAHFALPRSPVHQIMGMGFAAIAANYLAPDLGIYVQKYITTAIPFNLKLHKITQITDKSGKLGYFVKLNWIDQN